MPDENTQRMRELRNCPNCGYRKGFHIIFTNGGADIHIGLICPSCGQHFDLDWVHEKMRGLVGLKEEK